MSDTALIDWLESGAVPVLTADEALARRRQDFSRRFVCAMRPEGDLGATEEAHELAVALVVYDVHAELNALGNEEYSAVWMTLSARDKAAIKAYVAMAVGAPRQLTR